MFAGLTNAGSRVLAWVSAPGPVPGNQVGHASINVKRWSNSNIVRATINVALVLAMSQGLFSSQDGVFRADLQFGVLLLALYWRSVDL